MRKTRLGEIRWGLGLGSDQSNGVLKDFGFLQGSGNKLVQADTPFVMLK